MRRFAVLLCFFIFISCQDKVICPAFQSTYILDDSTRNAYFSYVWQLDELKRVQYLAQQRSADSTGRDSLGVIQQPTTDYYAHVGEYVVSWKVPGKSKYGIVKPVFYPIKKHRMRTAPMENILAPEPLSNDFEASEFGIDSLQADEVNLMALDSLATDSIVVAEVRDEASQNEEFRFLYGYDPSDIFNVEQAYYNKYFADRLIDHRPPPKPEESVIDSLSVVAPDSVDKKEPFFKGLFKKKDKKMAEEEPTEEEQNLSELTEEKAQEESAEKNR
ncbi:MAG: hypothetical protein GDA51_02430 [Ekhidna sp.]|nr:hypothetical protein [Ekhidna sp.]MBC6425332.1 hypothetical protein [Ekhidna sp.]